MNGVTIRELMEMPLLKDARVISGFEGMDRVVRFIDIMEVPDLRGWLREYADHAHFSELFERKLGKLHAHDKEHGSDFLRTLYHFLESSGNLIETSNRLYIHRNSVKYRLQRIREIIPIDLSCPRQRFVYHLCLTYHYLKANE